MSQESLKAFAVPDELADDGNACKVTLERIRRFPVIICRPRRHCSGIDGYRTKGINAPAFIICRRVSDAGKRPAVDGDSVIRKNARNGLAVVKVERDSCGGCHAKIPAQRQLDIRTRKKIIVCEFCGRILVDPEM